MNFCINWNKNDYEDFINYLYTIGDNKYSEFHKKIIVNENVIGIKTSELKKIAKEISKENYQDFFKNNNSILYEPIMIEGLVIGYLKLPFEESKIYIENYFKKVNNWAHIDLFVSNLKILKKTPKEGFCYAKKLIHSKNGLIKRCGVVILLDYYLSDNYIDKVLEIVSKIKTDDYYVQMSIAWLFSISYIKYKEKTLVYLVNIKDEFIYNKTLTKIIESRRIADEEKKFIKSLKQDKKIG